MLAGDCQSQASMEDPPGDRGKGGGAPRGDCERDADRGADFGNDFGVRNDDGADSGGDSGDCGVASGDGRTGVLAGRLDSAAGSHAAPSPFGL